MSSQIKQLQALDGRGGFKKDVKEDREKDCFLMTNILKL